MAASGRTRKAQDVLQTYRYLRIGMIGGVVLLAASIGFERSKVSCFQTSISAYYYTPVRVVFVGVMMAVGLSLIVYTGREFWEDLFLSAAGMFAIVVAIAPTTDIGPCWSIAPNPVPKTGGVLAPWVVDNINNNFAAALIVGAIVLIFAVILFFADPDSPWRQGGKEKWEAIAGLSVTAALLLVGWWLWGNWSEFDTKMHGYSAILFFVFLVAAIIANWIRYMRHKDRIWYAYAAVAALMSIGAIIIWLLRPFHDHTVFAVESYEIVLFAFYWILQTKVNWNESLRGIDPTPSTVEAPNSVQVEVRGFGFEPRETVRVSFVDSGKIGSKSATADDSGVFAEVIVVPANLTKGEHWINAMGSKSGAATQTFRVE